MALAYRVRVVTTGLDGSPYLSTFIFAASLVSDAANAGSATYSLLDGIRTRVASPANMAIQPEIETFDVESGDVGATTPYSAAVVTGSNSNPTSWTAKQGLLKLRTNTYRDGRRIQGRLFIPGVTRDAGDQHPISAYKTDVTVAAVACRDEAAADGIPWSVWSRPKTSTSNDGRLAPIVTPSVNNEWGVLRSRRT